MLYIVEPNILHFSCGMQKANTITKIIEEKLQWPKLYILNASASTFIESCRCKIKNSEVKVMKKKIFILFSWHQVSHFQKGPVYHLPITWLHPLLPIG